MITVTINGTDRSRIIRFGSLRIQDRINNNTDTCNFTIEQYGSQTYKPNAGDEVVVRENNVIIYGGVIVRVSQGIEGHKNIVHNVQCKDYSQYLDRRIVIERYENTNVRAVVLDLVSRYAAEFGFTAGEFVLGEDFLIRSVSFNEINMSDCLTKLARLTNYSWYVDYQKRVHFFKKNDELAPFNLTDNSGNYIFETLEIQDDLSQIRNRVKVRGGEARGEERTELYAGNGEQDTFPLGSKFAEVPAVTVDGSPITVGVDFLNNDEDFDAMWSYGQKYLRFTDGNTPPSPTSPATTNIEVTGIPLKPVVAQRQHNPSVRRYGVYEFVVSNDSLRTRDEALQYAQAELETYANTLRNGSFTTYLPGLKSGQTIQVNSAKRGINDLFMIQSVQFSQLNADVSEWRVEVATLRNVNMIDILQGLLIKERISEGEDETLLNFFALEDQFEFGDELVGITVTETRNYVYEQGDPEDDSYPNPGVWNKSTWD